MGFSRHHHVKRFIVFIATGFANSHDSLHFYGFGVDLVVLGVCAYEFDVTDAQFVGDGNDQAVVIALDVKNDAPVFQHASAAVLFLDVRRLLPSGFAGFIEPCFKGLLDGDALTQSVWVQEL